MLTNTSVKEYSNLINDSVYIMIDSVTFILPQNNIVAFGESIEIVIGEIPLVRAISSLSGQIYYIGYFNNLRFSLYETNLYVSNSLSEFIYGHNANDITYNQLFYVVQQICECLNCNPSDLIVKEFEFGFTLPVKIQSSRIMTHLVSHRNHSAKHEYRKTKLNNVKFYHHNYTIKIYDKTAVEKLEKKIKITGEWLRIEQTYRRKYFSNYITTASDLLIHSNLETVFSEFLKQWKLIKKLPFFDHTKLSQSEIHKIYALSNTVYGIDRLDYVTKDAVKKEQLRFIKQLEKIGDYSIFNVIERDFTDKFYSLLNNEDVPSFPALLLSEKWGQSK